MPDPSVHGGTLAVASHRALHMARDYRIPFVRSFADWKKVISIASEQESSAPHPLKVSFWIPKVGRVLTGRISSKMTVKITAVLI